MIALSQYTHACQLPRRCWDMEIIALGLPAGSPALQAPLGLGLLLWTPAFVSGGVSGPGALVSWAAALCGQLGLDSLPQPFQLLRP